MTQPGTDGKEKWVYSFAPGQAEGKAAMSAMLGGKGANLAEMANLGLPVPPGFTIPTEVCALFFALGKKLPPELRDQVEAGLAKIGETVGAKFGDEQRPLLVSVRSGSRASMPGMMDTILNLGLNDKTVQALAALTGDARFAFDSYRRFIQMYADVVLGVDHGVFEDILENFKNLNGFGADTEIDAEAWREIIGDYNAAVVRESGAPFPQDTNAQLWGAIAAVFDSWHNPRAATYRRLHDIPDDWGTAVNVQAMVFGNLGETSATGVAFTRNPSTGANEIFGEYLPNAQGEDVVAGIRTPQPLTRAGLSMGTGLSLEEMMPEAFAELKAVFRRLEQHYRDMQDVEFTIQIGKLW
ncbi:MAG: PEP/pyruvate-binding domain-containing protein, partial [Hyphomicrobium sp.]